MIFFRLMGVFTMKYELIPERLISARKSKKLNKAQAAKLVGLSPIGYLRYEQGLRSPSPQMLIFIATQLETSVAYLTGETDNPEADSIYISKENNTLQYELACEIMNPESELGKRVIAYYKKLTSS